MLPPSQFIHDLEYQESGVYNAAAACGVGHRFIARVLAGKPVSSRRLDAAMRCFYGDSPNDPLTVGMRGAIGSTRAGSRKVLRMLKAAAEFVQMFKGRLKISMPHKRYWVFPPKDTLAKLSTVYDECASLLKKIHSQCPELDRVIYTDARDLLRELREEDAKCKPGGVDARRSCGARGKAAPRRTRKR